MKQARRTRRVSTDQKPIGHGLREILFIFFCFIGLYVFVSLLTYDPIDLVRSNNTDVVEEVRNKGGVAGVIFADTLFNLFGYIAYLFPIMIGYVGWLIYQGRHYDIIAEPKSLVIPGTGFVLTLTAGCGLAIVHFSAEGALLPSYAGGLLGIAIGKNLESIFSQLGATLLLLALFFTGITLLTGLSWLKLMDVLGLHTLRLLPVVEKYFAQRFLPWLLVHIKNFINIIKFILASLGKLLQTALIALWELFQTWREDWQARRSQRYEEYDDDDMLFDKEQADEQLPQTVASKTIAPVINEENQIDNKLAEAGHRDINLAKFALPPLTLLAPLSHKISLHADEELTTLVSDAFQTLQMKVKILAIHVGPVLFNVEVSATAQPLNLQLDELSTRLAEILKVPVIKIAKTQTDTLTIEIPNPNRQPIYLSELLHTYQYQDNLSPLTLAIGKEISGKPVVIDLNRIPNILIAGSHLQEKATALHTLMLSILFKSIADTVKMVLVDSHDYKLNYYNNLPHLLMPVISKMEIALQALEWCVHEMERRYRVIAGMGVRNIESYNQALLTFSHDQPETKQETSLPYLVVVISEIADLMHTEAANVAEELISQLAQKARAAGIHLILATQFPSANVLTSLLKNQIPTRIAFQVTNKSESRLILGQMGAETLLGEGDMLYMTAGTGTPVRMHGCSVTETEVQRVVGHLKKLGKPTYISLKIQENN